MKKKIFSVFFVLVLVVSFSLVTAVPAAANGVPPATLYVSKWTEYATNPVFDPAEKAYYPTILFDGTIYRMWYADATGIRYTTSNDGITWATGVSVTGLTNANHPLVEYINGKYIIWYWNTAGSVLYSINAIRYAESTNGITWEYDQPLTQVGTTVIATAGWNRGSYGPCDVLYNPAGSDTIVTPVDAATVWANKFVMYYDGTTGGLEDIGLAVSADGKLWHGYNGGAAPVLAGGGSGAWDQGYASRCTVLKNDSTYHMLYSGGVLTVNHGIGHATSADGLTWTKDLNNPYLHKTDGVSWRADRTYTPAVIKDGSVYKMWLSGKDAGGNYAIGYATNANLDAAYKTIQAAITAASPGNTINVAAGTYDLTTAIVVDRSVTILGAQANVDPRPSAGGRSGAESLLVSTTTVFDIRANNVEVNGFKIESHINNSALNVVQVDYLSHYYDNVRVLYNIIYNAATGTLQSNEGIKIRRSNAGALVSYNYVYNIPSPGDAINFDRVTDGVISNNEVRNIGSDNAAIYVYTSTNTSITGNLVDTTTKNDGIKLGSKDGSNASNTGGSIIGNVVRNTVQDGITVYMSSVTVEDNEVYNSRSENGAIYLAYTISNINISRNSVHDNVLKTSKRSTAAGILLENRVNAATVAINFNNIYNNTPYGVTNEATALLNATNNWWGANNGPGTVGPGSGDKVSANVNYMPWLVLNISADPTSIVVGGAATSAITADMTKNSDGVDTSGSGHIPDGTQITFTTDKGLIGSLTVNKATKNGKATATLTSSTTVETATVTASAPPYTPAAMATTAVFFTKTYTITASAGAGGSISPSGTVVVNHGGSQTFAIAPNTGYHIVDVVVDGGSVGAVTSYDFTNVQTDHTITASFALIPVTYSLTVNTVGSGSVTKNPDQATYNSGTSVKLTATADPGWSFTAWSGDLTGSAKPASITMDANKTVTASFAQVVASKTQTTAAGDQTVNAITEADTEAEKSGTGTPTVTVSKYSGNPGTGFSGDTGKYIDVHIDDPTGVTEIVIKVYYTNAEIAGLVESSLTLRWWNGASWVSCSDSGVNTTDIPGPPSYSGYMWAKIRNGPPPTTPSLDDLAGAAFGGGGVAAGGGGGWSSGGGLPAAYAACSLTLAANMQGNIATVSMTKDGVLCAPCVAKDAAGKYRLEIDKGARVMLAGNIVPLLLRFREASTTPPTPENTVIVGKVYEFNAYSSTSATTPSPITISPPARLILTYDPDKLPKNATEVFIANYDTEKGWLALAPVSGVVAEVGKAHGLVSHFTPFAVLAKLAEPTPAPAKFKVSNLTVSPSQAQLNQEVAISVNVANTGGTSGSYSLELKVNGISKSTKQVTVAAGTSQAVSFTITGDAAGKHHVEVAGLAGEFEIIKAAKQSQINWWLIGGITGIILLLAIWIIVRWRRFSSY